jgi:hypothetical protein
VTDTKRRKSAVINIVCGYWLSQAVHAAARIRIGDAIGNSSAFLEEIAQDWDDDDCISILSNIRGAIAPDGRLVIVEVMRKRIASRSGNRS